MQNLNISQFNIRLAVVALIALSAISAFAISVAFSPQNGASADGDTNSEKVKNAVSALETAVANPDLQIEVLQTAVAIVNSVTETDANNNPVSILPAVSVKPAPTGDNPTPTPVSVSVETALGSTYLAAHITNLSTDASSTDARDIEFAFQPVIAGNFDVLKSATVIRLPDVGGSEVTATVNPSNSLEKDLDKIHDDLIATNRSATPFVASEVYAKVKTAIYNAFGLDEESDTLHAQNPTGGHTTNRALIVFYTPDNPATTNTNEESGNLLELQKARNKEIAALAGIRGILAVVKPVIDGITLSDDYTYTLVNERTNMTKRQTAEAALKEAKNALADLARTDEELTAFDELDALTKLMTDIAGEAPTGILKSRIKDINNGLLVNNVNSLDDTDDDTANSEELGALKTDATNHIISALTSLSVLDGKAVQMTAIQELTDLLTNVDDVVKTTGAADDDGSDLIVGGTSLTQTDADRLKAALDAFDTLQMALEARYVDTNPTDTAANQVPEHRKDLNDLANDDIGGQGIYGSFSSASGTLSGAISRDSATNANNQHDIFNALNKEGVLGSVLATAPASGDDEVTTAEFAAAIGVDIATDNGNTASTSDLHTTLTKYIAIKAAIASIDTRGDVAGIQPPDILISGTSAVYSFDGDLQNAFDNQTSPVTDNMAKANALAMGYRSSTLEFDAHAAMAALLDALEDAGSATGDGIDPAVNTAREALIIVYDQVAHYDADTQARITASYNALIRDGSTSHQFAQQAALAQVLKGLTDKIGAATLATNIQNALKTQSPDEKKAQAKIAEIKAGIFNAIIVSGGDKVKLDVNVYGVQGIMDQKLADDVTFDWGDASSDTGPSITYTAPTAPGSYDVTASLELNECYHADADTQMEKCSATFTVKVRRQSPAQPQDEAPVNPATVPSILTDSSGNQYEVFTPVEGGTFDNGEGYWITAQSGDVPNGEAIGVRMSDDGAASNLGMTHQRYTLGGNMYGIHVVDGTGASVSSYVLDDPAQVCLPLPSELSSNISKVALVAMNSDGTLTILSSSVKLGSSGTSVCGNISTLPASVAVGHVGSPAAIPTATPEPTPVPPPTGATAPTNTNGILIWAILLGLALTGAGTTLLMARRRGF